MLNLALVFFILIVWGLLLTIRRDRARLAESAQLRDELSRSEARFRKLIEDAPEAIVEWDVQTGQFTHANATAASILGLRPGDVQGHPLVDFSPEYQPGGRSSSEASTDYVRATLEGRPQTFEWRIIDSAGRELTIEVRLVLMPESGHLRCSFADVTDRARARAGLEESEARFRTLVNHATEAIVLLDVETMSFAVVNPSAADQFGYSVEELLALRPIDLFARTQPDGRSARVVMEEAMQQVLASEQLVETPIVARRANGNEFNVILRSVVLPGERRQVRSTIIDVTDNLRQQDLLRSAKEEAENASRTKTVFLAHMSHEIRTPMNGVLGMLELLMDSELSRDQRQSAELAKASAQSLLSILNDVLDISKIEAGQFVLEHIPFELHKMVNSIVGVLAPKAFQNGVEVNCEIQPGIPRTVMGDPVRLRQVLSNLVSNAVKFTRDGEVLLRLSVEEHQDASVRIAFSVLDTGVGIASERLAAIFDPFVQADESITRRFGGTGLGLAICRQLVGLMGGVLTVHSELGKGSEFRFSLSFAHASELDAPGAGSSDLDGHRILLVEENQTSRRIIGETLESACARVMAAGDVYSALRAARIAVAEGDSIALAIVDASMPDQSSLEFVTSVRGDRNLHGLKLMMLAAPDRQTDYGKFEALGVQAWLTKPVPQTDLIDSVKRVLAGDDCHSQPDGSEPLDGTADAPRTSMTILLAEDNAVNQRVATAMLSKRGHQVDVVGNGVDAVKAVKSRAYDLVLMDIQMPELDGIGAALKIREEGFDIRIVALTAHATKDDRERCLSAGMNDFLVKPFQPREFFRIVEGEGVGSVTLNNDEVVPQDDGTALEDEPVDIETFRSTMAEAGVAEIVDETLRSYLAESPERLGWLEDAMTSGDTEEVRKAAHALKSSSAAIGAGSLATLLERAEKAGRANDLVAARSCRGEIVRQYERVVDQLERVLAVSP